MIAKLDRLIRSATFLASLMESGVELVACDDAYVSRLAIHTLAAAAENESKAICQACRRRHWPLRRSGESASGAEKRLKSLMGAWVLLPCGVRPTPLQPASPSDGGHGGEIGRRVRANSIETARGGSGRLRQSAECWHAL